MLKRKALMESISSNLYDFLKKISKNLSLPDKKFLRDGLVGLLRAGQPIVCQMARHLPNQRTKFISRLDCLDQHLVKNSNFDNNVKETLPEVWLPYFQDDTPIILDLSDLAKRLAKKMDYLDNGWWIGWIEEVPGVNCQERTHEQLLETLKVMLKEALEFNRWAMGVSH